MWRRFLRDGSTMLLQIGDPNDLTAAYMGWLARRREQEVLLLAEDRFGVEWFACIDAARRVEIHHGASTFDSSTTHGAFVRFHPEPPLPAGWSLSGAAAEVYVQERRAAITDLLEALPCAVVNRPSAGRSNSAKPLHMALLQRIGFHVPPWIASNDRRAVQAFLCDCPRGAVAKAASGLRSHVRMVDAAYLQRLAEGTTPSIVQRYIPGHEVRVHVVAQRVFGARIDADVVDYRFDTEHARYRACDVPDAVARLCVRAAASEGLALAGLDFRVDAAGRWRCLEMNPVPTFLPYEAGTGHAIGDAVLDLLADGQPLRRRVSPLALFTMADTDPTGVMVRQPAA
jgi:glutathione synthase/RimK-type ligase-like ATP-grasp enzyme